MLEPIGVSEPSERQTYRAYVMWILAIQAGLSALTSQLITLF